MDEQLAKGPQAEAPDAAPEPILVPTIFLVDDNLPFLTATSRFMRASGYKVQTFSSPAEFLAHLPPDAPGCAILDLQMPGLTGFEVQAALARSANPLPVIFLTGQGDIPATVQAMRHGAEDFLTKRTPKENLLNAVRRALARDARERATRKQRRLLVARFGTLTPREREVLAHVLRGKLNKQIACELGVNERTVKLHRTSITGKMQVQSVAELISLAHQAGLFEMKE